MPATPTSTAERRHLRSITHMRRLSLLPGRAGAPARGLRRRIARPCADRRRLRELRGDHRRRAAGGPANCRKDGEIFARDAKRFVAHRRRRPRTRPTSTTSSSAMTSPTSKRASALRRTCTTRSCNGSPHPSAACSSRPPERDGRDGPRRSLDRDRLAAPRRRPVGVDRGDGDVAARRRHRHRRLEAVPAGLRDASCGSGAGRCRPASVVTSVAPFQLA